MANIPPGSRKYKRVFCETEIDSDSDEELDADVGIQLDNHGHAATSRHLHVEKAPFKCPKGVHMSISLQTPNVTSSSLPPKDTEKKKQVFEGFFGLLC